MSSVSIIITALAVFHLTPPTLRFSLNSFKSLTGWTTLLFKFQFETEGFWTRLSLHAHWPRRRWTSPSCFTKCSSWDAPLAIQATVNVGNVVDTALWRSAPPLQWLKIWPGATARAARAAGRPSHHRQLSGIEAKWVCNICHRFWTVIVGSTRQERMKRFRRLWKRFSIILPKYIHNLNTYLHIYCVANTTCANRAIVIAINKWTFTLLLATWCHLCTSWWPFTHVSIASHFVPTDRPGAK